MFYSFCTTGLGQRRRVFETKIILGSCNFLLSLQNTVRSSQLLQASLILFKLPYVEECPTQHPPPEATALTCFMNSICYHSGCPTHMSSQRSSRCAIMTLARVQKISDLTFSTVFNISISYPIFTFVLSAY